MLDDSVVSWLILTVAAYYGLFRLFINIVHENEKRKHRND